MAVIKTKKIYRTKSSSKSRSKSSSKSSFKSSFKSKSRSKSKSKSNSKSKSKSKSRQHFSKSKKNMKGGDPLKTVFLNVKPAKNFAEAQRKRQQAEKTTPAPKSTTSYPPPPPPPRTPLKHIEEIIRSKTATAKPFTPLHVQLSEPPKHYEGPTTDTLPRPRPLGPYEVPISISKEEPTYVDQVSLTNTKNLLYEEPVLLKSQGQYMTVTPDTTQNATRKSSMPGRSPAPLNLLKETLFRHRPPTKHLVDTTNSDYL